ncbi:hypothetical protein HKX48_000427 [Thoreauomyces humboldtii]|nr:hypothetical protein HKX48_000427 [Thoreauomyces humboldtii]
MTATSLAAVQEDTRPPRSSKSTSCLLVGVACSSSFLSVYAAGAVTIALPTIANDFGIGESQLQWIVSAYALTYAGFLLFLSRIADIYGQKRVFLLGLTWFAGWSLACGFMRSFVGLCIARALQGLGAAGVGPSAAGMIGKHFHGRPRERAIAYSMFGASNPIGFVGGIFLGGVFTQTIGWRWIFRICAIASFVVLGVAAWAVQADDVHPDINKEVDYVGAVLVTAGIILLTYAVSAGGSAGWSTPGIVVAFVLCVLLLVGFVIWESRFKHPLLPLGLFRLPGFAATVVVLFCAQWNFGGTLIFHATLALQNAYAMSPIATAVHLLPLPIAGAAAALANGHIVIRYPYPKVGEEEEERRNHQLELIPTRLASLQVAICVAMLLMVVASVLFFQTTPTTSWFAFMFPSLTLVVIGYETIFNFANILVQSSVGPHQQSLASGVFTTTCQIASGVGLAVESTISGSVNSGNGAFAGSGLLEGYRVAVLVAGCVCAGAFLFGLVFLPTRMPEDSSADHSGGLTTTAVMTIALEGPSPILNETDAPDVGVSDDSSDRPKDVAAMA